MSEKRYERIKYIEADKIMLDCPIDLEKGALLQDIKNNNILLQLKLVNITENRISSIHIYVDSFDNAKDPIPGIERVTHVFQDLKLEKGASTGERNPIILNKLVRNVELTINKVVFDSGEIWRNEGKEVYIKPDQEYLTTLGDEKAAHIQLLLKENGIQNSKLLYLPLELGEVWICSCGRPNKIDSYKCVRCQIDKSWITKHTNIDFLEESLSKHKHAIEKEKLEKLKIDRDKMIEDDKNKEIARLRNRKLLKKAIIVVPILLVIAGILFYQSDQGKYMRVNRYIEDKDYSEAIDLIESTGEFRDSEELYDRAIWELARDDYNDEKYEDAIKKIEMMYNPREVKAKNLGFNSYIEISKVYIAQEKYEDADRVLNELIVDYAKKIYSQELHQLRETVEKNYKKSN